MEPLAPDDPKTIGGHRPIARLGEGGMGQVFLIRLPGGAPAALKLVKPEFAEDQEFRLRFAREVAAAQRVQGAFTPAVVDADPHGERPWMATEYVAGPTLRDLVRDSGPLPEEALPPLVSGLAEALNAVHAAGIVHRDLKPDNVLLSRSGPQVIDFGIARALDGTVLTRAGEAFGTPAYMAPEQALGAEIGVACDVFALGGVIAYAATGTAPFGSGAPEVLLHRIVQEEPRLDGVPEPLRGLVARCLHKDPGTRPGTTEISAAIADSAAPADAAAWPPDTATHRIDRASRELALATATATQALRGNRRRTAALAAGAAAVALTTLGGFALAFGPDRDPAPSASRASPAPAASQARPLPDGDNAAVADGPDAVVFSPDGSRLLTRSRREVAVWDWRRNEADDPLTDDEIPAEVAEAPFRDLGFSTDGTLFAARQGIEVWDMERRERTRVLAEDDPFGAVRRIAADPRGNYVAVAHSAKAGVHLWDVSADKEAAFLDHPEEVDQIAFSPDGRYIAAAHESTGPTRVWDTESREPVAEFTASDHTRPVFAFSPDSASIAVAEDDGVDLHTLPEGAKTTTFTVDGDPGRPRFDALRFTPDGTRLVSSGSTDELKGGRIWDVGTGEEVTAGTDTPLRSNIEVHPGGEVVAVTGSGANVALYELDGLAFVHELG